MSENNIKQKAFKRGFGSPEARGALLVGGVIFIVLVACAVGAYFYLKSDTEVNVQTGNQALKLNRMLFPPSTIKKLNVKKIMKSTRLLKVLLEVSQFHLLLTKSQKVVNREKILQIVVAQ
jgi:hypothetical protein